MNTAAVPPAAIRQVPIDLIRPGSFQARRYFDPAALKELAGSIKESGVVSPVVLRSAGKGFELLAGERRWRAAQMAGLQEIPAVIREVPDDAAIAMALIENIQRENLNPLEEARALDRLIREFELTHQAAAEAVGRSRAAVSNLLRLLELSDKVKPLLESRQIEMGHARALLSIEDKARQFDAAQQVVKNGLSVRATERLVRRLYARQAGTTPNKAQPPMNADVRRLEVEITGKLGAKTQIDHTGKGSGRIVIAYNSLDELDGILKHIR